MHTAVFLHEFGHALGHWLSGGSVTAIVMLAPLPAGYVKGAGGVHFMSVWGGVTFGSLVTLAPLLTARCLSPRSPVRFAALMAAAFCLGHNALYLFVGSIAPFADASNMIGLGASRWLLFLLSLPLLVGFIFILTSAVQAVGLSPADSVWKRIAVVEAGLLLCPALMLMGALIFSNLSSMRLTMLLLVGTYAVCFGIVAIRARSGATSGGADFRASQLPQSWSPTLALIVAALLLVAVEWLAFRPA